MNMNQIIVQRESENLRKMSRLSIFNSKRFWKHEEEKLQTQQIEIEFNKLQLEPPPQTLDQQNLRKFCKQLQSFEYYNGNPIDINSYFIRILPQGQRCLVSSHQGVTVLKTINGQQYKFKSQLPGGGNLIGKCILDCFLCANTIYIYDIIQWGKMDMSDQVAEVRYFWIKSNILNSLKKDEEQDYHFEWIPVIPSLNELQKTLFPYSKNGLLFIQKDSYYCAGVNPECILYSDECTDDCFKEETIKYKYTNKLQLTLSLHQNQLLTRDGYLIASHNGGTKKIIVDVELQIVGDQLILSKVKEPTKFLEDPYSKVFFWKNLPRLRIE